MQSTTEIIELVKKKNLCCEIKEINCFISFLDIIKPNN